MNTNSKYGRGVGILFLLGFSGAAAKGLIDPLMNSADYLMHIAEHETQVLLGVFFLLVMAFACAGIGMLMYPALVKYDARLAIGAAGFRIIEGLLQIISAFMLFLVLPVSREIVQAGNVDLSYFQTLAAVLNDGREWVNNVYLFPWCIGALMYYYAFYRTKLIPRWLSIWGLVSITLCLMATLLVFFKLIAAFGTIQVIMNAAIALQELVMAIWLIGKGFDFSFWKNKKASNNCNTLI